MQKLFLALVGFLLVLGCKEKSSGCGSPAAAVAEDGTAEEGVILAMEGDVMPVGKVLITDFSMVMEDGKVTIKAPDQEIEGTIAMKETKKRKVEAIGERIYRYTVIEDRKTERSTMMGQDQPVKETVNPLEGRSVIAESGADGSWTAKLENGEATPGMEAELTKIAEHLKNDADFKVYGTVPRKVGDEWEVSASDMIPMEGGEGTMKVKFDGIEEFMGERCAKLSGTLDFTGRPEREAPEGMKMRVTGTFVVLRSLEHRIDLQNKLTSRVEISGDLESEPGTKISMKMEGPSESTGSSVISDAE